MEDELLAPGSTDEQDEADNETRVKAADLPPVLAPPRKK